MDGDPMVWGWVGRYLWAPMMAVAGGMTLIILRGINNRIDGKASTDVFKDLARVEGVANAALDRRSFLEYVQRTDRQRDEDQRTAAGQNARMELNQGELARKLDRLTDLVIQNNQGRRESDRDN